MQGIQKLILLNFCTTAKVMNHLIITFFQPPRAHISITRFCTTSIHYNPTKIQYHAEEYQFHETTWSNDLRFTLKHMNNVNCMTEVDNSIQIYLASDFFKDSFYYLFVFITNCTEGT